MNPVLPGVICLLSNGAGTRGSTTSLSLPTSAGSPVPPWCTSDSPEWSARSRCRSRLYSRPPASRHKVWRTPACQAGRDVLPGRPHRAPAGRPLSVIANPHPSLGFAILLDDDDFDRWRRQAVWREVCGLVFDQPVRCQRRKRRDHRADGILIGSERGWLGVCHFPASDFCTTVVTPPFWMLILLN